MPASMNIQKEEGYLHARVTGENTAENVFDYLMRIPGACERHGCPYVLIEECLTGPSLDIRTIFRIVSLASEHTPPSVKRIAYVDTNPDHDPVKMEFAGNVAVGLGLTTRIFATVEEARGWLLQEAVAADSR